MFPLQDSTPTRTTPFVTWLLIGLNVLCFLIEATMPEAELNDFIQQFGVVPIRFISQFNSGELFTVYSSMFLHAGWIHLLGNMWALFIFGDNVEDRLGHLNYIVFYFFCGTVAAIGQILMSMTSFMPMVGASGALAGILGAYILLYPRARVATVVPLFFVLPWVIEVPAILYLGLWFFMQFFTGLYALAASPLAAEASIAWWAHIWGFLSGAALVKLLAKRPRQLQVQNIYFEQYPPW